MTSPISLTAQLILKDPKTGRIFGIGADLPRAAIEQYVKIDELYAKMREEISKQTGTELIEPSPDELEAVFTMIKTQVAEPEEKPNTDMYN